MQRAVFTPPRTEAGICDPAREEMTMTYKIVTQVTLMTRRNLLSRGVVCALACLVPGRMPRAMAKPRAAVGVDEVQWGPNLYVFPNSGAKKTTVVALTWPILSPEEYAGWQPVSEVRIHSGSQRWDGRWLESDKDATTSEEKGCRIFAGNIDPNGAIRNTVVVEAPTEVFARDGSAGIWAERFTKDGGCERIGSTFIAAILAGTLAIPDFDHQNQ